MRERFKRWQPKIRINKWWVMGAIATPVFFWMVWWLWLLPNRSLQPDDGRLAPNERATLAHQHRETLVSDLGTIAAVVGGVFLLLNFRTAKRNETADFSGADFSGADLNGANLNGADLNSADFCEANLSEANLSGADLSGASLNGANLSGANLSGASLSGANLKCANLNGADLNGAELRYANLSGADLRYANLSRAGLKCANLSGADLNCALISNANLSNANLSGALLFFINSREVLNLEPLQLKAKPSPFLCNVALPAYSQQPNVNPNRDCDRIPQLLSARYDISLEEAQGIVDEARQHRWD
ncbi:pentapeptide repeat-containing protein [Nodosilinea sp. LEGE 07088]|uniref:pentapeptide repeat-containing protein n=1 Tax=Nodosilinea sp. LEGE 07088 TaxID=2777968 RepID=UPI001880DB5B|nr:pentapeptide repeat-containing protein [Nodosilinea sp. LEGE 07088]MBE9140046.1 pentapeptide repeat-containing protein [Nodosilinea sp. LEGE 07088]